MKDLLWNRHGRKLANWNNYAHARNVKFGRMKKALNENEDENSQYNI